MRCTKRRLNDSTAYGSTGRQAEAGGLGLGAAAEGGAGGLACGHVDAAHFTAIGGKTHNTGGALHRTPDIAIGICHRAIGVQAFFCQINKHFGIA